MLSTYFISATGADVPLLNFPIYVRTGTQVAGYPINSIYNNIYIFNIIAQYILLSQVVYSQTLKGRPWKRASTRSVVQLQFEVEVPTVCPQKVGAFVTAISVNQVSLQVIILYVHQF